MIDIQYKFWILKAKLPNKHPNPKLNGSLRNYQRNNFEFNMIGICY